MSTQVQVKVQLTADAKTQALQTYARDLERVKTVVGTLRNTLAGLGGVFAAGGVTAGFVAASQHLNNLAEEISRSAGRVGIGAEAYQVFGRVLKGAGGSAEDLTSSLVILRNALGEAIGNGESGPAKSLARLGLHAEELSRLAPEQQLERLAKALATVDDPARRASLAQDLLGRGAANLAPLLARLATDGYGKLRAEIAAVAGLLDDDTAKALDDLGDRADDAANRAAIAFAPLTKKLAEVKAGFAELFAEMANSPLSIGAGLGGAGAAAAGIAFMAPEAWGVAAGAAIAKAAGLQVPVWAKVGGLIAGGFIAAAAIAKLQQSALGDIDQQDARRAAALKGVRDLWQSLQSETDPAGIEAIIARAEAEAAAARAKLAEKVTSLSPVVGQGGAPQQVTTDAISDAAERANLEQSLRQYGGLIDFARQRSALIAEENRQRQDSVTLAGQAADRERDAAASLAKRGEAMAKATAEARRRLELNEMEPAARLAALEKERAGIVEAAAKFEGTASEKKLNQLETASKLVAVETEIAAARQAVANATERAADAMRRQREEAKRFVEDHRRDRAQAGDRALHDRLAGLQAQDAAVSADFRLTSEERRARRREILLQQQAELDAAAKAMRATKLPQDAETARGYEARSRQIGAEMAAEDAGTPTTALEGFEAGITRIREQWGTLATQVRTSVERIGDAITGSLAGGMEQLLGTTDFWAQKLGNIAGPIMGSITGAISQMFAQWMVSRAAAAAKNMMLAKAEGTVEAVAKAPGALMSSISSFGVAAAVGVAAFLAAKALGGGFFAGGFTGLGNPRDPAGIVHKGEYVVPADVVSVVGPNAFAGLVEAVRNPSHEFPISDVFASRAVDVPGASRSTGGESPEEWAAIPQTLFVDHRDQEMIDRILSDPRFATKVVHIGRRNFVGLG